MLAARDVARAPAWLRYANQSATRRLPLSSKLINSLNFLQEMGVTMEVFSGGQHTAAEVAEAKKRGESLSRTGSVRHDHGGAADAFFYKGGRRLDWANPSDRPVFEEIVRKGRAAGLTGFGAGDNYMRPGSMHIGFGGAGVWGAGGNGENAAAWLKAAFNGASAGHVQHNHVEPEPAVATAANGAPVMPVNMQEVTDDAILKAFGKDIGATPTNMPTAADVVVEPIRPKGNGVSEVTDPAIRKAFEGSGEAAPVIDPTKIRSDNDRSVGIGGMFTSGFTSDTDEEIRNAASSIYPNEPLDEAVKRFAVVEGELVHRADDGNVYRAYPGGLEGQIGRVASFAGPALPITAGTATGIVTAPMALTGAGLPVSMALTGGAGAAGEYGRQALGDLMLGDASTNSLNVGNIITEGATNALGQGISAGISALTTRGAARDAAKLDRPQTLRNYEEAKEKGIDITPAEASGLSSAKAQQQLLASDFRTADQMSDFYSKRNTQVMKAWDDFLGGISNAADGEDVAKGVRAAAKGVIDDAVAARQKAAGPLYDKAFKTTIPFTDTLKTLSERPVIKKAMAKAFELMDNAGKKPRALFEKAADGTVTLRRIPTVEEWNFIKFGLDDIIDDSVNPQTGKLSSEGRIYAGIKRELLDELDSLVPEYGQARRVYEAGSENVNGALESAIKRMADVKDPDILRETRLLFEPAMRSPNMVRRLGKSIADKDPAAWQAVKRLYLNDEAVRALKASEAGDVKNPAGKLWKTFENTKVIANIEAALSPEELESFKSLLKVYRVAGSAQSSQSATAYIQEAQRAALAKATPIDAKLVGGINPAEALRSYKAWRTETSLTKHAESLVELITSGDPGVIKKMKELRQLSPNSRRGIFLFGQMLAETTAFGVGSFLEPQNYDPNQQPN